MYLHDDVRCVKLVETNSAAGEVAPTELGSASVGDEALLSKLPAPKKKKRPVLLTVLAEPIPDSDSDVGVLRSHLAVQSSLVSCSTSSMRYMLLLVQVLRLGLGKFIVSTARGEAAEEKERFDVWGKRLNA